MKSLDELEWSEVKNTNKQGEWLRHNCQTYLITPENIDKYQERAKKANDIQIDNFWFDMRDGRGEFEQAINISMPENHHTLTQAELIPEQSTNYEEDSQYKLNDFINNISMNKFNKKQFKEPEENKDYKDILSLEESLQEFAAGEELLEKVIAGYFTPVRTIQDYKKDKEDKMLQSEKEKRIKSFTELKGNTPEILSLIKKYTTPPAETQNLVFDADWSFEEECDSDFLIPDLGLAPEEAYVVVAPPFTGKSFFATHLILSVISGQKLFNHFEVLRTGTALWLDYDSNIKERKKQIAQVAGGMGISMTELSNKIEYSKPSWKFNELFAEEKLNKLCTGKAICIVDTISGAFNGDENTPDYGKIVDMANRVSSSTNCTIVFLSHTPKGWKYNGNNADTAIRGSGSVLGTAGGNWILQREGQSCRIICHKNRKFKFDDFGYTYRTDGNFLKNVGCFERVIMEYKEGDCSGPNEDNSKDKKEQIEIFKAIKAAANGLKKEDIKKIMKGSTEYRNDTLKLWIEKGLLLVKPIGPAKYCVLSSEGEKIINPEENQSAGEQNC